MADADEQKRAVQYREQAAACLQWASKMLTPNDRQQLLDMAERWLALAKDVEQKAEK
jgi:hypothetical protein